MDEQRHNHEQIANAPAFSGIDDSESTPIRHSGLGVASFILSIVSFLAFIGITIGFLFLIANRIDLSGIVEGNDQLTLTEEELADKIGPFLGYLFLYIFIVLLNLVGLILGLVGLAKPGFKKVFSVLGTVLNGLALLSMVVFVLVALAQRAL